MIQIQLSNNSLWSEFSSHMNEMIITRNGRCMFPQLKYQFTSIGNENHYYGFALGMLRLDKARWKFRSNAWHAVGKQKITSLNQSNSIETVENISLRDLLPRMQLYEPRESPKLGSELMIKGISFAQIKLANRFNDEFEASKFDLQSSDKRQGKHVFVLQSFCRYQPVLIVVDLNDCMLPPSKLCSIDIDRWINNAHVIRIDTTQFIAVTHYQNERITDMKKVFNPHAKGFHGTITKMYNCIPNNDELNESEYMASRALEKLSRHLTTYIASPPLSSQRNKDC